MLCRIREGEGTFSSKAKAAIIEDKITGFFREMSARRAIEDKIMSAMLSDTI